MKIPAKSDLSVIIMALILFFGSCLKLFSLPLNQTIFTIPVDEIEVEFHEIIHQSDEYFRREHISLGFGILYNFSMWISVDYLHKGLINTDVDELADSSLKLFIHTGDYFNDLVNTGFLLHFNLPTGRDAYSSTEFNRISFGNNEIKLGPVIQMGGFNKFFIHFNLMYIFRESEGEDIYDGFQFNIFKKDTYVNLFGLNPFTDDTFLNWQRLKNDYFSISVAINTDRLYPFIPYFEFKWSDYFYNGGVAENDPGLSPCDINPILLSTGLRFFFSSANYTGLYFVFNPIVKNEQFKAFYGVEFSFLF